MTRRRGHELELGPSWLIHAAPSAEGDASICFALRDSERTAVVSLYPEDVRALMQLLADAAAEAQLQAEEVA